MSNQQHDKQRLNPHGLTQEAFEAWRTDPATKMVMKHLADLETNIREQWAAGEWWTDEMRQYARDLSDFQNLEFEGIEAFYEQGDEEDDEQA